MVQVQKLNAETLLGAPRRGVAVPNHNGSLALYTLSTHNFDDGKTRKEVRVADLTSDGVPSRQLSDDDKVHDAVWIPGTNNVVYLKSGDKGATKAFVANAGHVDAEHYVVGEFDAPIANLKLKRLDDGGVVFVVTGLVGPNGELYNEEAVEKRSTARVFDTAQIRVVSSPRVMHPSLLHVKPGTDVHQSSGIHCTRNKDTRYGTTSCSSTTAAGALRARCLTCWLTSPISRPQRACMMLQSR